MDERGRARGKDTERAARDRYQREGWEVIRRGWPDFLLVKFGGAARRAEDDITEVAFAECKASRPRIGAQIGGASKRVFAGLKREQRIVAKALLSLGLDYRLEWPRSGVELIKARANGQLTYHPLKLRSGGGSLRPDPIPGYVELLAPIKRRRLRVESPHRP